jgi:hypothetical protein
VRHARSVAWGSIPLGTLTGGFLASAFGAQTTLLILTAIMGAVAAAATLARPFSAAFAAGAGHAAFACKRRQP